MVSHKSDVLFADFRSTPYIFRSVTPHSNAFAQKKNHKESNLQIEANL